MTDISGYSSVPVELLASLLPEWLAVNTGADPEDTMYRKILEALADIFARPAAMLRLAEGGQWLPSTSRSYPRLIWTTTIDPETLKANPIPFIFLEDHSDGLRRVYSQAELLFAEGPVYAVSDEGDIFCRNIAQWEEGAYWDGGGKYSSSDFTFFPGEPVFVLTGNRWENVSVLPGVVDYETSTLNLGVEGPVRIRYTAKEFVEMLPRKTLQFGNELSTPLVQHDLWNPYDEAALLVSLSRIPGEDNADLAERIRTGYTLLTQGGLEMTRSLIGHEFGLVGLLPWNGTDTIELDDLGIEGVTYVTVLDLPKKRYVTGETLVPDAENKVFTSSAASWDPDWVLFVNGTRVTTQTYPDLDESDILLYGRVDFGEEVLGDVTASFSCALYTATSGQSASIVPTVNTPPGNYTILCTRSIDTHSTLDETFIESLYSEDGTPNELYLKIAEAAAAISPILIGKTGWGDGAHWFDDMETTPPVTHLPVNIK